MAIVENISLAVQGSNILKVLDRKKNFKLCRTPRRNSVIAFLYRGIMITYNREIEKMRMPNKYRFSTDIPGVYGETSTEVAVNINNVLRDYIHFDTKFRATCLHVGRVAQTHCRLRLVIEENVYVPLTENIENVTCPLCFNEISKIEIKKNKHHDTYGFQDAEDVLTYPEQMDWSKHNKDYWANVKKWGERPVRQL